VSADATHPPGSLPDWSAVPGNSEADRVLVNRRVAYFGGAFALLSLAFYVRNVALISFMERAWPPVGHPILLLHTAAIGVGTLQWLLCRKGRRSAKTLNLIDVGGLLASMALYAALTIAEASGFEHAVAVESAGAEVLLIALIMMALVVTHAIIVPATVRRMFWVSSAAAAIGPVAAYLITAWSFPVEVLQRKPWMPVTQAMYVGMWGFMTVAVSTIAAKVIHGLQQRVRAANEVGQYRLEEKIGEGGMGVVYLARHALLRRPTAIKLLAADRAGEQAVQRFEQEVQLTSALTHPNTIAIFDFGRTPDGIFYYAMEYLDGVTLEDLVAHAGAQPPARIVHILQQVCGALVEAHAVGLVHRDIKPANLMLCVRGRVPDHIKVLDFGLVKDYGIDGSAGLSAVGVVMGTPAYLAPEAIRDPSSIDARSDLYAVGAVGYHLLVGEPVFRGRTVFEICAQHLHSQPTFPSPRPHERNPIALERLVLRCLAKDPSERPASAAQIIDELDALARSGTEELGTWTVADAQRWWQDESPAVTRAVKAERTRGSTPGPGTVAVDLTRRGVPPALGPS
jgi:eukaryotic-like serine/threonine-protein kinase